MRTRLLPMMLFTVLVIAACGEDGTETPATEASGDTTATEAPAATGSNETDGGSDAEEIQAPDTVNLSIGTGLAYAPLTIIRQEGWLEERFPDVEFGWQQVTGGAATRDAMLAGEVDFGVAGTAPFLVGWGSGVGWKILGGQGILQFQLVSVNEDIRTLEDLAQSDGQITAPSPDSGQAIALRKNAADAFGDPHVFDDRIAAMGHPEAFSALITGQTDAAYTGPPFQYRLVEEEGAHLVENGGSDAAFGPITFTSVVVMEDFYAEYPDLAQVIFELLEDAQAMLTDDPRAAAQVLSDAEGGETSVEQWEEWISLPENDWTSTPAGVLENGEFMAAIGMIESAPTSLNEVAFPTISDR